MIQDKLAQRRPERNTVGRKASPNVAIPEGLFPWGAVGCFGGPFACMLQRLMSRILNRSPPRIEFGTRLGQNEHLNITGLVMISMALVLRTVQI